MKLKPIEDWRRAWKFASVQLATLFAFLFSVGPELLHTWAVIPEDLKSALPEGTSRWVASGAFGLVVLGRIFKFEQKPAEQGEDGNGDNA